MKLQFAGLSDQGLVRSANQDSYCIDDPQGRFFIVADGMGGHAGGEEASRIATHTIREFLEKHWTDALPPESLLKEAIERANQSIVQTQKVCPERADMGTTAVVVIFPEGQQPWSAHVGDSRLYRLRDSALVQITEDHTWVAQAVRAGILTLDQARVHPWRHVLAQCLGREELNYIDIQPLDIQNGDTLLLCSDGLTEEVLDEAIAHQLVANDSCHDAATALVEEAKVNGGQDNITVVLVAIDEITTLPDSIRATIPGLELSEVFED
ncbi:MAG: Stp1/IreP family PP2C-type Ser/Thr phosphatase [Thermosynechococcaceae cyanobacterium]